MLHGIDGELRERLRTEFLHYVFAVRDGGIDGDIQLVGYLLVDHALGKQPKYLDLAASERLFVSLYGLPNLLCHFIGIVAEMAMSSLLHL